MGHVILIGTSHNYQLPGNPAAEAFRMFVEQVYATKTFRAIAEEMSLEEVEAFLIKKALARNNGNARKAAEALGLSRSAFYRRLQQYGL